MVSDEQMYFSWFCRMKCVQRQMYLPSAAEACFAVGACFVVEPCSMVEACFVVEPCSVVEACSVVEELQSRMASEVVEFFAVEDLVIDCLVGFLVGLLLLHGIHHMMELPEKN